MKNYYEILEISENASQEMIERAYDVLIEKYNPDNYVFDEKVMAKSKQKEINEAYQVLRDTFMRAQYDNEINSKTFVNDEIKQKTNFFNGIAKEKKTKKKAKGLGTFQGIVDITEQIYENRPEHKKLKDLSKTDIKAIIITVFVIILILIALWFIPFTNGFVRSLTVDNPLFSWMFK